MTLLVRRPGPFTTIQDLGRPGFGACGVPPSGAMDCFALRLANRLVGNADELAGLEFTLAGPDIEFQEETWVALAGSRFESRLDGDEVPHAESFIARRGQVLTLGRTLEGARGYVAVGGGVDVPVFLGSRATLVTAGFGGYRGRALRGGDRLEVGIARVQPKRRTANRTALLPYGEDRTLHAVPGPQAEAFSPAGRSLFFSSAYAVSQRSDRMGIRLEGPAIERVEEADLAPEGLAPGAIQVPADGQPIVLGADRPTTGGYTKIATVITADLGMIGQAKPGDRLRFAEVSVEEARRLWQQQEELLASAIRELS